MPSPEPEEKSVVVLVRTAPVASERAAEALRVAVGQTLAPHGVTVCLMGDGVWSVGPLDPSRVRAPEVKRHVEALLALGHAVLAEEEAVKARGIGPVPEGIEVRPRSRCLALLTDADVVLAY